MPRLSINRIPVCKKYKCTELGIAEDFRCLTHTKCSINDREIQPSDFKNPQGIELEVESSHWNIIDISSQYAHRVDDDCSLDEGVELKFIHEAGKVGRIAAHTLNSIKRVENIFTQDTCGFHVHIDMRKYTEVNVWNNPLETINQKLYPYLQKIEEEIYSLFPSRMHNSNVSKMHSYRNWNNARMCWISGWSHFHTKEIRIHPGTVNPNIVIAWSKVCKKFHEILCDIAEDKKTKQTEKINKGNFRKVFQKGTIARHYLDYRNEHKNERNKIEREYVLPTQ